MPLGQDFRSAIAAQFNVDESHVQVTDGGVSLNGVSIGSPGIPNLKTFLDRFDIQEKRGNKAKITDGTREIVVRRMTVRDSSEAGLIEVNPQAFLFLGSFGINSSELDISSCPELITAVALLTPVDLTAPNRDWTSIIEKWGPIVVTYAELPEAGLAELGCFCERSPMRVLEYRSPSARTSFIARDSTSDETLRAYVLALEAEDGPDVTIHRLYRIFELEFAQSLKADINNTPLSQVWKKLRDWKLTELKALEAVVTKSQYSFQHFDLRDFESLFGVGHMPPEGGQYSLLRSWLSRQTPLNPTDGCRAQVIYYVRNALVHSKVSDGDTFLFGPYEGARAVALINLAKDIHTLVRDLIAG